MESIANDGPDHLWLALSRYYYRYYESKYMIKSEIKEKMKLVIISNPVAIQLQAVWVKLTAITGPKNSPQIAPSPIPTMHSESPIFNWLNLAVDFWDSANSALFENDFLM